MTSNDAREVRGWGAGASAVFETALDCVVGMDAGGLVVEWNSAAERTFGYARTQAVGRMLAELIIPERLREGHRRGMERYLATGEATVLGRRVELPALRSDGRELLVELAITRVPGEGAPLFIAYLRDITQRVRAEQLRNLRLATTQQLAQASVGTPEMVDRASRSGCHWRPVRCPPCPNRKPCRKVHRGAYSWWTTTGMPPTASLRFWACMRTMSRYDGMSAIEIARRAPLEVVFLDIGMPGLDGHETARRLRQLPGMTTAKIIALTGWGQEQDRRRSERAGFDSHLVKPPDLALLREALRPTDRIP